MSMMPCEEQQLPLQASGIRLEIGTTRKVTSPVGGVVFGEDFWGRIILSLPRA
jgi:hypothetical protein